MFSTRTGDYTLEQDGGLKDKGKRKIEKRLEKDRWRNFKKKRVKKILNPLD